MRAKEAQGAARVQQVLPGHPCLGLCGTRIRALQSLSSRLAFIVMQVDCGNVCAFWASALAEVVAGPHDTILTFWRMAADLLIGALYVYTAAIMPPSAEERLIARLGPVVDQRTNTLPCGIPVDGNVMGAVRIIVTLILADGEVRKQACEPSPQGRPTPHILKGPDVLHAAMAQHIWCALAPFVTLPAKSGWPVQDGFVHGVLVPRGIGLACSAFGSVVQNDCNVLPHLVAKWSQGRWAEHMLPLADYLVALNPVISEEGQACMSAPDGQDGHGLSWDNTKYNLKALREVLRHFEAMAGSRMFHITVGPGAPLNLHMWLCKAAEKQRPEHGCQSDPKAQVPVAEDVLQAIAGLPPPCRRYAVPVTGAEVAKLMPGPESMVEFTV